MTIMLTGSLTLFKIGDRRFQLRHLIVIGVLGIAFTTAFIMRSFPIKYGFYLNEFDPYFDYRATKYIVDNGLDAYWKWHDTMSWYPEGRDIPKTSQSGLHIAAAFLYEVFGRGISLLDFTILLPVVLGSLTTIIIFALVRTLAHHCRFVFGFTLCFLPCYNTAWKSRLVQIRTSGFIFCPSWNLSFHLSPKTSTRNCGFEGSSRWAFPRLSKCLMGWHSILQHSNIYILNCSNIF